MEWVNPSDAVSAIKSFDRVFIHGGVATPQILVKAMVERALELRDVEIVHLHTEGDASYVDPKYSTSFHTNALFVGGNVRQAVANGQADYIPVFLSEVPGLFRKKILPLDIALVQVSPPDKHGYCSLGVSVDVASAAVHTAVTVIAQVNPHMPRTHGDGLIHISQIRYAIESNDPIPEMHQHELTEIELTIGKHCAELIDDGATLQTGIGAIPDAVLSSLTSHKNLGVHTEMFSDGIISLIERGVINGSRKRVHPGKIVSGFVMGTRQLYDFIDDNPLISMLDIEYVNDTAVIRRNPKVTAINSAIEVDLTGQVCADSVGTRLYSGVGGQMDFIRGASLSDGGKPIIALPSRTQKGESRIVAFLKQGAGVVTTRAHVHYVVTEHGVAYLYGKNLRERARALINISHPDDREMLEKTAHERFKIIPD
ncbi:MAG: acetyl-CoA hydrolase/transferase family protein [Acidobacteria bacterium]|nr:acetyl-CoA hydrolase/transferase family protein [Acidobacteriota bacterium]